MSVGCFVSIDGPGGAGKSTVTLLVVEALARRHVEIVPTAEPSSSTLGSLLRRSTERFTGLPLACLIAADRYDHLERLIRPALARGAVVVCDRYVPSSLVLQRMDGVGMEFIAILNQEALRPDLAVILTGDPATLRQRVAERGYHSRFERMIDSSELEVRLYAEAAERLETEGWNLLIVDSATSPAEEVAATVVSRMSTLMKDALPQ